MDRGAEAYARFLSGDDSGLKDVIEAYRNSLAFFLLRYVKSESIAEELLEDTFYTLVMKRPRYEESASFRAWLFRIARNKALNFLNSSAYKKVVPIEDAEELCCPDSPEAQLLRQERYRELYRALDTLPQTQRDMVYLVYFEGMKTGQAAKVIRKTPRQGANILLRAKKSLKEILEKEGFEYEEQY